MWFCKAFGCSIAALLCFSGVAQAGSGYMLGVSAEADNAGGRALSAFVDYGVTETTWLSGAIARTETSGFLGGLDTIYADAAIEQQFGQFGVRLGAAYWGDNDILDSADFRASTFYRAKKGSLSLNYERRAFGFTFSPLFEPDRIRTVEFDANGIGASGSIRTTENIRIFASGMSYSYSQNIRLQPRIDTLRFLSSSRLSLMNSLIDYRISGGVELQYGQRAVDLTYSSWQTAIDGGKVRSFSIGFVAPTGSASDLELRVAFDQSENFGDTLAFAVSFYFFGG